MSESNSIICYSFYTPHPHLHAGPPSIIRSDSTHGIINMQQHHQEDSKDSLIIQQQVHQQELLDHQQQQELQQDDEVTLLNLLFMLFLLCLNQIIDQLHRYYFWMLFVSTAFLAEITASELPQILWNASHKICRSSLAATRRERP